MGYSISASATNLSGLRSRELGLSCEEVRKVSQHGDKRMVANYGLPTTTPTPF